jgi:hypothetical protein
MDIGSMKGALNIILTSAAAAVVALAIAAYFPSIIPARAAGGRL